MPVLALRDLSFRYRRAERPALRGAGLDLEEGEVVWLAGPSGAGKTTLACTACGVAPEILPGDLRGEARLFGRPVGERRVREWADTVGVLFQDFEAQIFSTELLLEAAFGPENLALPREEVRRRAEGALERTGLAHLRGRDPATLSGGEKQRLALASILALEPRLLLLDEPTTDLDPGGRRDLLALVRELAGEGRTTLLIEHDPEAAEVADRAALLEAGTVTDILTNRQALSCPDRLEAAGVEGHPVVCALLAAGHPGPDPPSGPVAAAAWLARSRLALAPPPPDRPVPGDILLRARGLGHAYLPGREALVGVELELREGEVVAVVGPNGSGKTTLAHALAGLLRPTAGEVRLRGRPVQEVTGRIGLVFQNPDDQIFSPRVADEVAFAPRNAGLPEEEIGRRVSEALEAVRLADGAEADPFELPKGERQKVAVASVLAQRPDVLVLDEPTTGLDARERRGMLALLGRLAREGHAIVLVTHSMEVAAEMADRVVVLRDGSVAAEGRPREIFGRPGLLDSASLAAPAWAELTAPFGPPALTLAELRARRKGS